MSTKLTRAEKLGLAIVFDNETHAGEFDGWHMRHKPTRELIAKLEELDLATSTFHDSAEQQYSYYRVALTEEGIKQFEKAKRNGYHKLKKEDV